MEKLKNFPGTTIAIVPDNRTSWLDAKYKDFKMKEYVSSLVLGESQHYEKIYTIRQTYFFSILESGRNLFRNLQSLICEISLIKGNTNFLI